MRFTRPISILRAAAILAVAWAFGAPASAAEPERISIDYAYYNPVSLLLKEKGWLEQEFAKDEIDVRWVLSLGSNKALEFLRGGSVDFGSSAGAAALVSVANGNPVKVVYIYSRPEWTALVTRPDTGIKTIADLKGKRVAVTRGTDPHIFLLQALNSVGLSEKDIQAVLLQHPDGGRALAQGQVDAWAGLDPHMAQLELEHDALLFYRAPDLNTYGVLNVRRDFARDYPGHVERVLAVYERARRYSLEHPDELRGYLVKASKISDAVAAKQLNERTDLGDPVPGAAHRKTLLAAGAVLQDIGMIKPEADVPALVDGLLDPSYIARAQARKEARR